MVTKEQFEQEPRARELRAICLSLAHATDAILYTPQVDEAKQYATIETLNGRLIELEITPDFQTGLPQAAYKNPVTVAEYMAGQWMTVLAMSIPSEQSIVSIVHEHSEASTGNAHLLKTENIPSRLKDFVVMQTMVNMTYQFLDAK